MPSLHAELHAIVPFYSGVFHFADEFGRPAHIYNEQPRAADVMPLYHEAFYEKRDREVPGLAYSEASPHQFGVHDSESAIGPDFRRVMGRSDIYNLIARPFGYDTNFLRLFVRDGRRRRTVGAITLYARTGWRGWTDPEKRRLARLEPFLAYALTAGAASEAPLVDSGRSGVIIADSTGRPIHLSPDGRRLLFLAMHPELIPGQAMDRVPVLPPALAQICSSLSRAASADATSPAPVHHHRNLWGGFRFRAEWLGGNDAQTGRVAITVSHEEPLPVRLTRAAARLPLTPRQAEVCVLMAAGMSREQIADRLGIAQNTAREHGRWIYHRLDVHSRSELLNTLLAVSVN